MNQASLCSRPRAAAFTALLLAVVACAQPVPPSVDVPRVAPPPSTQSLEARWISSARTSVGVPWKDGRLILLSGRRAFLAGDNVLHRETVPLPEPLDRVVEVPTAAGLRLVGCGTRGIYRLDDPLGAAVVLAQSSMGFQCIGGGPGVVALLPGPAEGTPWLLDVETGRPAGPASLPWFQAAERPRVTAMLFRDMRVGVVSFADLGLALTTDGGASFRAVQAADRSAMATLKSLRRHGEELWAVEQWPRALPARAARVDVGAIRLEPAQPAPPATSSLLRWIDASGQDPVAAAAATGIASPLGGVLVSSGQRGGAVARVDLATGAVLDFARIPGHELSSCTFGGNSRGAWIGCDIPDAAPPGRDSPFHVFNVPLDAPLALAQPAKILSRDGTLVASPSGGVLLGTACTGDNRHAACVLQPDGRWHDFTWSPFTQPMMYGPLADGRVAALESPKTEDSDGEDSAGEPLQPGMNMVVTLTDAKGKRETLAQVAVDTDAVPVGAIEEDASHALHFVLSWHDRAEIYHVTPGKPVDQRSFRWIRLRAGHAFAIDDKRFYTSVNSGRTWTEADAPPDALRDELSWVNHSVDVSEIGARVGSAARVGWGPAPLPPPAPALQGGVPLTRPPRPPSADHRLACVTRSPVGPKKPAAATIEALLGMKPPAKSTSRRVLYTSLDGPLAIEEDAAKTWTLRWRDRHAIGNKVQAASGPAPELSAPSSELKVSGCAMNGEQALVALEVGQQNLLIRAVAGRPLELIGPGSKAPEINSAVLGLDKTAPVAWKSQAGHLWVWFAGEEPREIAPLYGREVIIGRPTHQGLPVWLPFDEESKLLRVLELPASAEARRKMTPAPLPLEGWTRVAVGAPKALPACGSTPPETSVEVYVRDSLAVRFDGNNAEAHHARYDVRVTGTRACIASMTADIVASKAEVVKGAPITHVRADLASGRAEGRSTSHDAARKLTCTLER